MIRPVFDVTFPFRHAEMEPFSDIVSPENSHLLAAVRRSLDSGEYSASSKIFQRLAETEPMQQHQFLLMMAFCHFRTDNFVAAIPIFSDLLKQNQEDYQLHLLLGMAYYYLGLRGRANTHWWAAQQVDRNQFILNIMGLFFSDEHHPERLALFPICQGRGIDVGCGHRKTHPESIGVDMTPGGEQGKVGNVAGQTSMADVGASGDHLWMFTDNELDYVVQRHNLEHYKDYLLTLQEWKRVLRPGGILGMVVPDDEECDTLRLDPTHYHVFTMKSLARAIDLIGGFRTCFMGKLLKHWSFVCILQKDDDNDKSQEDFDYLRAVRNFEVEQLVQQTEQYEEAGDFAMATQCRLFTEQLEKN